MVDSSGWTFSTTFAIVGLPVLSASVNKYAPSAEPATPREHQPGHGPRVHAAQLAEPRQHAQDQDDVLPEHQHVGIEHIVERDAPGALGAPQPSA